MKGRLERAEAAVRERQLLAVHGRSRAPKSDVDSGLRDVLVAAGARNGQHFVRRRRTTVRLRVDPPRPRLEVGVGGPSLRAISQFKVVVLCTPAKNDGRRSIVMLPTNGGQSDQALVDSSKASGAT